MKKLYVTVLMFIMWAPAAQAAVPTMEDARFLIEVAQTRNTGTNRNADNSKDIIVFKGCAKGDRGTYVCRVCRVDAIGYQQGGNWTGKVQDPYVSVVAEKLSMRLYPTKETTSGWKRLGLLPRTEKVKRFKVSISKEVGAELQHMSSSALYGEGSMFSWQLDTARQWCDQK